MELPRLDHASGANFPISTTDTRMPVGRTHGPTSTRNRIRLAGKLLLGAGVGGGLVHFGAPYLRPHDNQIAPTVHNVCRMDGSSANYEESLTGAGYITVRTTASRTGCPNHVNYAINPNSAMYIPSDVGVPAYPMLIDGYGGVVDLSQAPAAVGILFNGVALFSAWAAFGAATTYETSATYLEGDTFDMCGGHSTRFGVYHYHNTPGCLQEQAMQQTHTTNGDHSPQLGWSYDGFPVYGQLGPNGVEMLMCGSHGAHRTYCLDKCNGYAGTMRGVDGFMYRYYLSCGFNEKFFPFTTNCYRGCCPHGMTCGQHMQSCGHSARPGYTIDYVPQAEERRLDIAYESVLIDGDDTDMIGTDNSMDCSLYEGEWMEP